MVFPRVFFFMFREGEGERRGRREKGEGEEEGALPLFQRIPHPFTFHHTNLPTYNTKHSPTQYSEESLIILWTPIS